MKFSFPVPVLLLVRSAFAHSTLDESTAGRYYSYSTGEEGENCNYPPQEPCNHLWLRPVVSHGRVCLCEPIEAALSNGRLGDSPVITERVGFPSGLGGLCGYVKNSYVGHYFCKPGLSCEGFKSGGWAYGTCQELFIPVHVIKGNSDRKKPHGFGASILFGTTDADFASLDSRHPYAWVVGPLAVEKMLSMSGRQQLDFVGWPLDFVDKALCSGQKFKIVKFDFKAIRFATRADWDGLVYALRHGSQASEASQRCADKVAPHLEKMKKHPWKTFIGLYGDPRKLSKAQQSKYNSVENFANSGETGVFAARAFLYYTLDADELYAGDGWTYDAKKIKGGDEYLTTPMLLRDIQGHTLTDMDVHCPHGQAPN